MGRMYVGYNMLSGASSSFSGGMLTSYVSGIILHRMIRVLTKNVNSKCDWVAVFPSPNDNVHVLSQGMRWEVRLHAACGLG